MPDETQAPTPLEQSLDEILAQYIASEEAGRLPDRQVLLRQHPRLANELREFFTNRDQMQRLAEPLRAPASGGRATQPLGKIRYFGDYELLEEIAAGGMGIVYKARQVSLSRIVAVKMILKGTLASEDDVKRFRAEAEAAANLQHPAIVAIHEVGLHEGQHYFSMDFVDGQSLAQLPREQPLTARQAAEYVRDAAEAVHYAHQQGTLHRDLKPSNILIDRQGRVRITDFGLAKKITGDSELTLTGQILGTPSYMPPEQALGKRSLIGAASDIYSLGAVLYELLTGRPPFRGESPVETLKQVETLDAVSPRLLNPAIPRDLETICLKCLEKEPHKRYGTSQLLADDLGRYLRGEAVLARPPSTSYRLWKFARRNKVALATATVVIVALVLGTAVSTSQAIRATKAENLAKRLLVSEKEAAAKEAAARKDAEANLGKARQAVQQMLTRVAEERLAYIPQLEEVRSKLFEDALHFYEELLKQEDVDPAIRLEAAMARLRVGNMARVLGRDREAEEHCRAAVTIMERLCREQPESEQFQVVLSDAYQGLGEVLRNTVKTTEAVQALEHAIRLRSDLAVRSPKDPDHRQRRSVSYRWLALALPSDPSRPQDAAAACRKALEISQRLVSEFPSSPDYLAGLASAHYTLCTVLDKGPEAEAAHEHLQAALALFERLESALSDAPASLSRELGTTHQGLAAYRHDFASAYCRLGDWRAKHGDREGAADAYRKGMAIFEMLVTDFPSVPLYRKNLALNLTNWSAFLASGGDEVGDEAARRRAERALDTIPSGDRSALMEAGREQVKRQAWDQAAAYFAQVLDQLPHEFLPWSPEMRMCLEMVQQPEVFASLIDLRPGDSRLWVARSRIYASGRQWAKASADAAKVQELRTAAHSGAGATPQPATVRMRAGGILALASLRLLAGDEAGYRDLCATVMSEQSEIDDIVAASLLSRVCTLAPDAVSDWSVPVRLANLAVAKEPRKGWHLFALGAAQYRAGQHVEAIQTLEKSLEVSPAWVVRSRNYVVLAMACQQLGRTDEARDWLAKTKAALDEMNQTIARDRFGGAASEYLEDGLAIQILLPEAEKLIAASDKP